MDHDAQNGWWVADGRALTPEQWQALKEHAIRRAHAERGQAIRDAWGALFRWLRRLVRRPASVSSPAVAGRAAPAGRHT